MSARKQPQARLLIAPILTVALLCAGFWGAMFVFRNNFEQLTVEVEADGAVGFHGPDGPFVITHLAFSRPEGPIEKIAAIDPPIAFVESGWQTLPAARAATLKWETDRGEPTSPPPPGAHLRAIYVKGKLSPRD